jgi:gamma-glutamyltranspeptidase
MTYRVRICSAVRNARSANLSREPNWVAGISIGAIKTDDMARHEGFMTVADCDGRIVWATQSINSLFGARYMVPCCM